MSNDRHPYDVDDLIRSLQTPPAPREAPPWPADEGAFAPAQRPRPASLWTHPWLAGGLAAAATLCVVGLIAVRWPTGEPESVQRFRGGVADGAPEVDLALVVQKDGTVERLGRDAPVEVGQRVFFRVWATEGADVTLWVEGPQGTELIAEFEADTSPIDVRSAAGLIAYAFDAPGHHVFRASTEGKRECEPPSCSEFTLEVR